MLINLTPTKFEELQKKKQQNITERFGTVLDYCLPIVLDEKKINSIAEDFFVRITAALDTCANEPKENAVCMEIQTRLEKKLMSLLMASQIEVLLSCF